MTYPTHDTKIDTRWRKPGDWAAGYHPGVDFEVPVGTRVNASAPSTVVFAGRYGGWGQAFGIHVICETIIGGKRYRYVNAHLSKALVKKGQHVATDQLIGLSGNTGRSTGPHDHLEVRDREFKYGQDVDPAIVLAYQPGPIDKMDPANYGPGHVGPHITELGERLVLHGFDRHYRHGPGPVWGPADEANVRDFQLAQGWTGADADGQVGEETLRRLYRAPRPRLSINWDQWKVTLPTGPPRHPKEVRGQALVTYQDVNYRRISDYLAMRAPCEGVTTSGSGYPRCEFRELDPRTGKEIGWNSRDGKIHELAVTMFVTELPKIKDEIVIAQIHDKHGDVVMVRLEGTRLIVESDGDEIGVLDEHLKRGVEFRVRIVADKSGIVVYYRRSTWTHEVRVKLKRTGSGWFFKAGVYTQATSLVPRNDRRYGTGAGAVGVRSVSAEHRAAA